MRKVIIIDIDSERQEGIHVGYSPEFMAGDPNPEEDMAILCEAICTLIHAAHRSNIKKDFISVKDCVDHITKGFADGNYKAVVVDKNKEGAVESKEKECEDKKETES